MNVTVTPIKSEDIQAGHVIVGDEGGFSLVQERGPELEMEDGDVAIVLLTEHGQLWLPKDIWVGVVGAQAIKDALAMIELEEVEDFG